MGIIPAVTVQKGTSSYVQQPGKTGRIAVIGAFDKDGCTVTSGTVTGLKLENYTSLSKLQLELGDGSKNFLGCKALPYLWHKNGGVSSVTVANITSDSKAQTEITTAKLAKALELLMDEQFDILFVCAELDDTALETIVDFRADKLTKQSPIGFVAPLSRTSTSDIIDSAALFADGGAYGLLAQKLLYKDSELTLVNSAAYYCSLLCDKKLDQSFTNKVLPDITGVNTEYTFEDGDDGYDLVEAGVTIFKIKDRINKKVVVVNSITPSGLDVCIERTVDYIIKDIYFDDFLGDRNTKKTLTAIESAMETKKKEYIASLELVEGLEYTVEKESSECVNIYIDSLIFAGVITKIGVYINVEVE